MAIVNGANYDHSDIQSVVGGDTVRHMYQDTAGRAMLAPTEASSTASAAHTPGTDSEYFVYNNKIYQATSPIAQGGTIVTSGSGANCKEAPLGKSVSELKSALDDNLLDKITTVYPSNWYNENAVTDGKIMGVDGTETADSDYLHTDYIPVAPGDIVKCFRNSNYENIYHYKIAVFDANKTPLSAKGNDTNSKAGFTIQSGISFAIVTFKKSAIAGVKPIIVRNGVTPTSYSAYFDPYTQFAEDFLTPQSKAAVQKVADKALDTTYLTNTYACALPKGLSLYQTIGIPETWYISSMATPPGTFINISAGSQYTNKYNDKVAFPNTIALDSANGFNWYWYDLLLKWLASETGSAGYGRPRKISAENLPNCSLLVIGDSTVDQDTMTEKLLSHFTEQGKTLTLLGTLGSGDNKNEGRAGWSAADYYTDRQYNGVTNPFYNPTTQTFDFSYYMQNQSYSGVDYVVIQLGINDLYNFGESAIEPLWSHIAGMIDSIRAFSTSIKIILDLPTTPNSDQSQHTVFLPLYLNRVIRYNELAIKNARTLYGIDKVRCSYCHLILNPATDIRDNVHPTAGGYEKMALEIANQINNWQS